MERFTCYTVDFIFGLPMCKGVNEIMAVVDRANKWVALIPINKSLTNVGAAEVFLKWVVRCYWMPQKIIAYWNSHFMSAFLQ